MTGEAPSRKKSFRPHISLRKGAEMTHIKASRAARPMDRFLPLPTGLLTRGLCASGVLSPTTWDLTVEGETQPERRRRRAFGAAVCDACPVKGQCATYARACPEISGIWGGLVFDPAGDEEIWDASA